MTIEIALLVAWGVLVSALIWRLNRVLRLLSEVRGETSALWDMVSRLFLMQLNCQTENKPPPARAPHRLCRHLRPRRTKRVSMMRYSLSWSLRRPRLASFAPS
jgi:hypothetical protein